MKILLTTLFIFFIACSSHKNDVISDITIHPEPVTFEYIVSPHSRADTVTYIYRLRNYHIREMFYNNKVQLTIKYKDTTIIINK